MIVNFLGIDHKVGTTMITQSIADAIAYNDPSLNIIRLALHNRLGLDYYPHAVGSVDDLLISLDVKYLDAEDFEAVSHKTGSLRVLGGLKDISLGRKFGIEETKYLLKFVSERYDLVIVDAGAELDNGLTAGALSMGDQLFYVATQSESCLQQFSHMMPVVKLCCSKQPSAVILNKFLVNEVYNVQYISKRLDMDKKVFKTVPMVDDYLKAERDHVSFFGRRNKQYDNDILAIADLITIEKGIGPLKRNNKGIKQLLGWPNSGKWGVK